MNLETISMNKKSWEVVAERFFGRTALPEYGPFAPLEDELNLLGDLHGLNVLDIGCGSGHSLKYMDEMGAAEVWGLDLTPQQIKAAQHVLKDTAAEVKLFESPMENNPGIPENHFDLVYSIYALGWTTNLEQTLTNIHTYLKPGGTFVFSWEHPLYSRINHVDGNLLLEKSYHEEGPYDHEAWQSTAIMQQFKVSTYMNALIKIGFTIERVVEEVVLPESDREKFTNSWYSCEKAEAVPTTLIIKSTKR
ncbi:class I SAM-dependent methyltransferase [Fictibacillus sp. UD]|uniref:class I SAM-dependent methyltransferase n=1 Tax=Fictibacillus sp. UD TaxID=3038777 RepID=UPI003746C84A